MRRAAAVAIALALAPGCLTTGRGNRPAVISVGGSGDGVPVPAATPAPEAEAWASITRSLATLQREGVIAVNVEAYWPDETPAEGVVVEVTGPLGPSRKATATVDAVGVARLSLPTLQASRWRVGYAGVWLVVGAPQLAPDPSGAPVIRGAMMLPPPGAFRVPDVPAHPGTAVPAETGIVYPPEMDSQLKRLQWLKAERAKADETGDAERARALDAEFARYYERR